MLRILSILLTFALLAIILGCGGSVDQDRVINIRDFEFEPNTLTVPVGATVRFTNADSVSHTVVSGELDPTDDPRISDVSILNNQFSRDELAIMLGDILRFRNTSNRQRQVEIKDRDLDVVYLSPILQPNQFVDFTTTQAGQFQVRDATNPAVLMILTVQGVPDPDGLFSSPVLSPGEFFEFTFDTPGSFPFFCGQHNAANGTVIVEP